MNVHFVNYRTSRNKKKMMKMLRREGLPEYVSIKIAEYIFPKMEFSPWRLVSTIGRGEYIDKKERKAHWKAG